MTTEPATSIFGRFDMKVALANLPQGFSEEIFDSLAPLEPFSQWDWEPLDLQARVGIERTGDIYHLKVAVACKGRFTCDYGLELFEDTLRDEFNLVLAPAGSSLTVGEEEELIKLHPGQTEFDLSTWVREAVILAIPIAHTCGPRCAHYEELKQYVAQPAGTDPRWAALNAWSKKENNQSGRTET